MNFGYQDIYSQKKRLLNNLSELESQPRALIINSTLKDVSLYYQERMKGVKNIHSKCTRRHRHRPQQGRSKTSPESKKALGRVRLLETISHAAVLLPSTESIGLHLTLDDIERVTAQPQRLACQTTIASNLHAGDFIPLDIVALRILVHKVFEGQEPHAVRLDLTEVVHRLAAEETAEHALVGGKLANAIQRTAVEATSPMGLGLKTDTDVLDRAREDGVGDTGETSGHVVLDVGETGVGVFLLVEGFQTPAGLMEGTKLHANLYFRQFHS